jgi:hypothetical protein
MPFPSKKLVIAIVVSLLAGITTPLPASGTDLAFDCDPAMPDESGKYYVNSDGVAYDGGCNEGRLILDNSVRGIGDCAFCEIELTYVVIPEGVITIGENAFDWNPDLISVTIPDSVISIGARAFRDNYSLRTLTFGANSQLVSIGEKAFEDSAITSVTIPSSVTDIDNYAFDGDPSLIDEIIFAPNSRLVSIGEYAFGGARDLDSIEIPRSVTSIGKFAFSYATALTSLTFEDNSQLESIGEGAFRNTYLLESIEIPRNVTSIGEYAFENARALEYVTFEDNSQLELIREGAFKYTKSLISIEIPSSVTTIGENAFEADPFADDGDPSDLLTVTFGPNSQLETIGVAAFAGASSLENITIPTNVTSIGAYAFSGATALINVFFSGNSLLETIGEAAFSGASSLENITIPSNVISIGENAFGDTTALTSVFFRENSQLETILPFTFTNTSSLISIDLPSSLTSIGESAFRATGLMSITIPESVTTIGNYAFAEATSLSNFYFMGDEPVVQEYTFESVANSATAFIKPGAQVFSATDEFGKWFGLTIRRGEFSPPLPLYRNWQTPLAAISNGPKVGETVYASAFERELPRTLYKNENDYRTNTADYPTPEEYVYRITKQENAPASSVDHQPYTDYESLSSESQSAWYQEIGFTAENPYRFTWKAFMCVNPSGTSITKPNGITLSYASREDGLLFGGSFNSAHDLMLKEAATDWHLNMNLEQTIRSAVGFLPPDFMDTYTRSFLGELDPAWHSLIWGLLDVNAACGSGKSLQALTVRDSEDSPITTKSFDIPEQLNLQYGENDFQISSVGITIGVTGAAPRNAFNAALWGLTTIADSSTPPAPTSGGGGSSSQTPTPTPSATSSPRATQSANPIIQNRLVIPTQLKPGTTNNPEPLIKKLIEDVSNSLKPIIVNIFTQQSPTPNPLFDSKRALEVATPARDKKVIELPSLVRIDNELQSSKLVVIDNTSVQVVTEGGGMLSVEAKDGVATIPVDNTGKVQMIRSNTVNTNGVGLLPNSEFAVYLFSEPTLLGIGKSDLKGNFYASFMVDKEFPLGNHTLQVNGILSNGKTSSISMPVTVVENADIAHSQATPESNLDDENPVTKANNVSYLIIAIFILLLIIMLFGGSRLFLVAGRRRQED